MVLISKLHGKDVFTNKGQHVGKVADIVIDAQQGKIVKLAMAPLVNDKVAMEVLQNKSIDFEDVLDIGDVIIVRGKPQPAKTPESKRI